MAWKQKGALWEEKGTRQNDRTERVMVTVHHMTENLIMKAIISCSGYILTMLLTFK